MSPSGPAAPTAAAFHVLLALAQGERHGYAIMQEAEQGGFRMGPGKLYGTIKRLIEQGLIEEIAPASQAANDERRRYYRLTREGGHLLRAEATRLEHLVRQATERGVLPGTPGRMARS